jgi:acetyl-CoA acetyltransferase
LTYFIIRVSQAVCGRCGKAAKLLPEMTQLFKRSFTSSINHKNNQETHMNQRVYVSGVGMIPFVKPGTSASYDQMGMTAGRLALADAGISYDDIEQAYVGYVYGDSTAGQKALYQIGMSGIPIVNVNNNCSTGSSALFLARQAIASGAVDCVLVLGFEQMSPGALGSVFQDRPSPFDAFDAVTDQLVGMPQIPLALRYFGGAGLAHMQKYGTPAGVVCKNPRQSQPPCGE